MKLFLQTIGVIFLLVISVACTQQNSIDETITAPNTTSYAKATSLFSEGSGITLSPDGQTAYFVKGNLGTPAIFMSSWKDQKWSEPQISSFSGQYFDVSPVASPDGKRIYFRSKRPTDPSSQKPEKTGYWYIEKKSEQWDTPKVFQALTDVLAPNDTPMELSISSKGNIYITINRQDEEDIYCLTLGNDGTYSKPKKLGLRLTVQESMQALIFHPMKVS